MAVRQIVQDVLEFVGTGVVAPALREAHREFGFLDLRLFCINLTSWWRRSTLLQIKDSYLPMSPPYPWHVGFQRFVVATPELCEMLRFDDRGCHFADCISREELEEINEYVRSNHRPQVFRHA
jgi:hypothetical protein